MLFRSLGSHLGLPFLPAADFPSHGGLSFPRRILGFVFSTDAVLFLYTTSPHESQYIFIDYRYFFIEIHFYALIALWKDSLAGSMSGLSGRHYG